MKNGKLQSRLHRSSRKNPALTASHVRIPPRVRARLNKKSRMPKSRRLKMQVEAAQKYLRMSFCPIPLPYKKKSPRIKGWPSLRITRAEIKNRFGQERLNIGIILGDSAGRTTDVDLDTREAIELAPNFLPNTDFIYGRPSRPRSHWLYRTSSVCRTQKFQDTDGTMLVELRSQGCQAMVPPSVHPGGELVRFYSKGKPADVKTNRLEVCVKHLAAATLLVRHWPKGSRHDLALAISGALERHGWATKDVQTFLGRVTKLAGDEEPLDRDRTASDTGRKYQADQPTTGWPTVSQLLGEDVSRKLSEWLTGSGQTGETSSSEPIQRYRLTPQGNADLLVAHHGDNIRYCAGLGGWFIWNGKIWEKSNPAAENLVKAVTNSIYAEAEEQQYIETRETLLKHARRSDTPKGILDTLRLARTSPRVVANPDQFDRDPYLLTVKNGTVDLRTGTLSKFKRDHFITRQVPVDFDPEAKCPLWDEFFKKITKNNIPLIDYIQRLIGYSLTGDTSEQCFFFLHGSGANGKTTLLEVWRELVGEFAVSLPPISLQAGNSNPIRNDLASLAGARLVTAVELDNGIGLSEVLIKQLTGGDPIRARFLNQEFFDYVPQFKLVITTNHLPRISGTDEAIWRRVRVIPFEVTIPPDKQDRKLLKKLKSELSGILNWAIRGCLAWQKLELQEPPAVTEATNRYRAERDPIAKFISQRCVINPTARVSSGELYERYRGWCVENDEIADSMNKFGRILTSRGYRPWTNGPHRYRLGLTPKDHV